MPASAIATPTTATPISANHTTHYPMMDGSKLWVQWVAVSGGWLGEKFLKNFFVPNELKSPKNNMSFLFLSVFGDWFGGSNFFNSSLIKNQHYCQYLVFASAETLIWLLQKRQQEELQDISSLEAFVSLYLDLLAL